VVGHTDASGSPKANQTLSKRRAASVRDYLLKLKIEPQRLKALGKGQSELLNEADPLAAENRRVEFSAVSTGKGN
jgi:OOP family OmpA-OmpF porin